MRTFDEQKERAEQRGDEWILGAVATDLALIPVNIRMTYTPYGVLQHNDVMDTNGCASRAPLNILEAKLNYLYDHGMHPDIKKWCDDNGYRKDGKFLLCDAYIEILSGTTPAGNSLKAPVDAIYRYGVIPAHLIPLQSGMTWAQYMNRARVTQAHMDLGKQFLLRLGINYEKVYFTGFPGALERDLLDCAVHAWPDPINNVYPRTDAGFNHAIATVNPWVDALDNYTPFLKRLATDYKFFEWGYQLSITRQTPNPVEELSRLATALRWILEQLASLRRVGRAIINA